MVPIWSSVKWRTVMALVGHVTAHTPQPLHRASLTCDANTPGDLSTSSMALYSQTSLHRPHALQSSSSTEATMPSASTSPLERMVAT